MPTAKPAHRLMKSEPAVFSFDHLLQSPGATSAWDGVRNFQARNHLRAMRIGDLVLFYHSSCNPPGVVGIAEVVRTAYPDPSQFEPTSPYFDARSRPERPLWDMVDLRAVRALPRMVTLQELRSIPALAGMALLRRGNRLSVLPLSAAEWKTILAVTA